MKFYVESSETKINACKILYCLTVHVYYNLQRGPFEVGLVPGRGGTLRVLGGGAPLPDITPASFATYFRLDTNNTKTT